MYFFLLFQPLWLWNALVDVQWTAAKQSMFSPASNSSKVVELMFYEDQITSSWDNLQEMQKEKTTKLGAEKNSNNFWSQSESFSSLFLKSWLSWDCLCLWWQCTGMYVLGRLHFWRLSFIQLMKNKSWILTGGKEKLMGTMWFVCYSARWLELPPRALSCGHFTAGTVLSRLVIALSLHGRTWQRIAITKWVFHLCWTYLLMREK